MITLEDVGIPDYSREEYLALPFLEQIRISHIIKENGLDVDSPIPEGKIKSLLWRARFDNLTHHLHFLRTNQAPTFKEYLGFLEKRESRRSGVEHFLQMVLNAGVGPYFTNNFYCHFPHQLYRVSYPNTEDQEWRRIWGRLDELISEEEITSLFEEIRLKGNRDKKVYPYYITLKREGFSSSSLKG